MSKYIEEKGRRTCAALVEACRTPRNIHDLVEIVGLGITHLRKRCTKLREEGWIDFTYQRGMVITYRTIRDDKYPVGEYEFKEKQKEPTIPGARVFRMEDFNHRKHPLRPLEHRGIGSTFGRFDTV